MSADLLDLEIEIVILLAEKILMAKSIDPMPACADCAGWHGVSTFYRYVKLLIR